MPVMWIGVAPEYEGWSVWTVTVGGWAARTGAARVPTTNTTNTNIGAILRTLLNGILFFSRLSIKIKMGISVSEPSSMFSDWTSRRGARGAKRNRQSTCSFRICVPSSKPPGPLSVFRREYSRQSS